MDLRFVILIQDLFVITFLSSREHSFLIRIRRWCRICISAFPFGFNSDGFSYFWFDLVGLPLSRDHDHDYSFSKLRKDFQTRIWDPGDSNYNTGSGGSRQFTDHTYGNLFELVLAMFILVLPRSETSLLLCIDIGFFFHLMFFSFGIRVWLLTFKIRDINLGFGNVMAILLFDQLDAKARIEMFFTSTFRISGRTQREKAIANSSDCTKQRTMDINEHQWVGRYRRHDSESFQATYQSICSITVMRKAFRSFIYKMIACYKCMKKGLNKFILLPVRLLLESRVTSTSSSKLGFNFLYLFQRLYLNFFLYHVSCKPFMK